MQVSTQVIYQLRFLFAENYVLNYLATQPKLENFVSQALVQLYARITKQGWFDSNKQEFIFRNVIPEITKFLNVSSINKLRLHYSKVLSVFCVVITDQRALCCYDRSSAFVAAGCGNESGITPCFQLELSLLKYAQLCYATTATSCVYTAGNDVDDFEASQDYVIISRLTTV